VSAESASFRAFVVGRSAALVRSACLLTGNEATAQDLVQTALMQTWRRWDRIDNKDDPEGYVRRVIMTTFLSWRRRRWRYEHPTAEITETASREDEAQLADLRHCVALALASLPPRQRAVVILRYFDHLSEAETARALGCSVGTVKSHAARALTRLRHSSDLTGLWDEEART
jgi:RNA polymerase sigma-70 factor (sigma-E family)